MSLLIAIIALIYAVVKAGHIQTVNGQSISTFEVDGENRSPDDPLNLNEKNFRIAFAYYTGYEPFRSIDDPRYMRLFFRAHG